MCELVNLLGKLHNLVACTPECAGMTGQVTCSVTHSMPAYGYAFQHFPYNFHMLCAAAWTGDMYVGLGLEGQSLSICISTIEDLKLTWTAL